MKRIVIITALSLLLAAQLVSATELAPRVVSPLRTWEAADLERFDSEWLHVKFVEGSNVLLDGDRLSDDTGLDLTAINATMDRGAVLEMHRTFTTERALARVEAALADHPESAALHRVRAQVLGAAGRPPEDLRAALEHSVALDPQDPQAVTALARLLVEQGEVERALVLYDGVGGDAPIAEDAAYAAARLLVDLGRLDQAERRLASLL